MNDYEKMWILSDCPLRMLILIKTLIVISARGIETNCVVTPLKTTSIAVESLILWSGRVHLICSRPCNLMTLY